MKRILLLISVLLITLTMAACGGDSREKLYVLNWGEYIDPDLVVAFEDEFNVDVVYEEVGSNEEMEIKIKSDITAYDIAIPSDYMIDKLRQQNLLNEIDMDLLTNLDDVTKLFDPSPGTVIVPNNKLEPEKTVNYECLSPGQNMSFF